MASAIHLISIAPSHFCEKARWALDYAGVTYKETKHAPVFHFLYTRGLGQGTSCPKLVLGEGRNKVVLNESSDIVKLADKHIEAEVDHLYPSSLYQTLEEWDSKFNKILGPHVRRFMYCYLLYNKHSYMILSVGAGYWERCLTWCFMPILRPLMYYSLGCNRPGAKNSSLVKIQAIFKEVDNALADGRPFICGEQFTAADLSFAALAGPLVQPKERPAYLVPLDDCPKELQEALIGLRETLAGQHVLKIYQTHRYKKLLAKQSADLARC